MHVGILGGTGPAGRGLAVRLAEAGVRVTLGSRDAERAAGIAADVVARWPRRSLEISGAENRRAAEADVVVVATPWESAVVRWTMRVALVSTSGQVVTYLERCNP